MPFWRRRGDATSPVETALEVQQVVGELRQLTEQLSRETDRLDHASARVLRVVEREG